MEPPHLPAHPDCLRLLVGGEPAVHLGAAGLGGEQILFHPGMVGADKGVGRAQNLRGRAVVLHHHNGFCARELLLKVQQEFHIRPPPGVDGLVRIPHNEQVLVIPAQHLHQIILGLVYVLELVNHNIFQPLLPFPPDIGMLLEDVQGEHNQIIIVQAKALLLLVKIAVEDNILRRAGPVVLLLKSVQGHGHHILIVARLFQHFADFNHLPGVCVGHFPHGQSPLLIDSLEHGVNIRVVQHQKALGVLNSKAVLLENGHAEAVEGVDIARVIIAGQAADALAHLVGGLVGKGDAEDIAREDAQLVDQKGKAVGEGTGFAGTGARNHPDKALSGGDSLQLGRVKLIGIKRGHRRASFEKTGETLRPRLESAAAVKFRLSFKNLYSYWGQRRGGKIAAYMVFICCEYRL